MFIQTEETPNPATLKFLPGRTVMAAGTADFPAAEAAKRSPLAEHLFGLDGVTGVFLGSDFITVTKNGDRDWYLMKPAILGVIMEHFVSGQPVMTAQADSSGDTADDVTDESVDGPDAEIIGQIKELSIFRSCVAQLSGKY